MTRPGVDIDLPRGILIPLQLIACLILADLSYRFVELPFNGKAKLPRMSERWLRVARPALILGVLAVILVVGWSGIVKSGSPSPEAGGGVDEDLRPRQREAAGSEDRPGRPQRHQARAGKPAPPRKPAKRASRSSRHSKHWPRIVMLGDSVMIGAEDNLAAAARPGLLDGRQSRAPGRRIHRDHRKDQAGRPPPAGDGDPVGQQRPALQRRHGGAAQGDHQRRPALPDLRPRPGLLAGRVQRSDRRSLEALAQHDRNPLGQGGRRRRRKPLLGRHPPDPEGRRRLRPPRLPGPARKDRLPESR